MIVSRRSTTYGSSTIGGQHHRYRFAWLRENVEYLLRSGCRCVKVGDQSVGECRRGHWVLTGLEVAVDLDVGTEREDGLGACDTECLQPIFQ